MTKLKVVIFKKILIFILILPCILFAQVTYTNIPLDKQLVPRDINNKGLIIIEGLVDKTGSNPNYDSISIEIYRTDNVGSTLFDTKNQALSYSGNIASFNFSFSINAELANYSIKIFGIINSNVTNLTLPVGFGNDIVSGDVFIIQGQSNAEASIKDVNDSSQANESEFIRVYASGTIVPDKLVNDQDFWSYGKGDADQGTSGNTGQWGIKLARLIMDSQQIPIAIFNGATGNEPISYFLAPPDYQNSLESNYGRLYYRLNKTGLKESVKAVLWSQGEVTMGISTLDYKNSFLSLTSSWINDYPNVKKYYIFQTKTHGLGISIAEQMETKEAQRQLANENANIHIMSTEDLASSTEPERAHFVFTNGYESFATRIFSLVERDFYSGNNVVDIEPPMVVTAVLISDTTLVIETNSNSLIQDSANIMGFQLENAGSAIITDIVVDINKIVITLSENPGSLATVSFVGLEVGVENGDFIRNSKGIELVCFYKFPIDDTALGIDDFESESDIIISQSTSGFKIQAKHLVLEVKVYNLLGKMIYQSKPNKNSFNFKLDKVKKGSILIMETKFENGVILNKKTIKY